MTTISQYSLGQIRDTVPSKAKQQWSRIQANAALAICGAALVAGVGCYWDQISSDTPSIHQAAITAGIGCYLGYRLVQATTRGGLERTTVDTVKRVAETLPIAPGESQIVPIDGQEFLAVTEENSVLDIYRLAKARPLGADGKVSQLFSLHHNNWGKVMKVPREGESTKKIENALRMVKLVNPDGKTRGCITAPYLVTQIKANQQSVVRGTLMRAYDADAALASEPNGIIDVLRKAPHSEPYFVDIVHQALSVMAKLQESGIAHNDIRAANLFLSRGEDGFIDFHLGDWDEAFTDYPGARILHARDVYNMGKLLYEQITGRTCSDNSNDISDALPPHLRDIIPQMLGEEGDIRCLLNQLNQALAWAARPDAPSVWQNVARRTGIKDDA